MHKKPLFKNPFYMLVPIIVIASILLFLLLATMRLEKSIETKIFEISTSDVFSITHNSATYIETLLKESTHFSEDIKKNSFLQRKIEESLKTLLTPHIKYAYLLYRDNRGVFRFLSDASIHEEKAFIDQKLDVESPEWLQIYSTKAPLIIRHTLLQQLSISYLVPILNKGDVELILAIDFSIDKIEEINQIIHTIQNGILGVMSVIFAILIFVIIQTKRFSAVRRSAFIDKLTNVYNRNYLQKYEDFINLDDYILATLDIDYFKKVNDTYGHDVGDTILKQVASTILLTIRHKDDIVIRYGGEEFLILAKTRRDGHLIALNMIERIFYAIQENAFAISDEESIKITVSIGVNLVPHKSRTFQEAFKLADIALYNAKTKGRNTIEIYDENENTQNTCMSLNEIKAAIEEHRIECYYQKIVHTTTQELSHYEALLRIIDKNGNVILPDRILPTIKGTFILRNITKEVLSICYEELLRHPKVSISVNLNPHDVIDESILSILKNYALQENIAPRLGLEIIETEDITNREDAKNNLLMLKSLGYTIYIDDFGSGYSNFIYLAEIKTDYIKIDGAIIQKVLDDKISFLLVKNIVAFAKEAQIKVIAEYVSDASIYGMIQSLGIEYAQGLFFSTPSPLIDA
ncbi:bifunctional diguanylate cyclase/phosphodiesterase [Sulfurospirillum multivorans]|uniref:Diguanylate cyclase/phosphodiesterase n=2 Tax=Sulfurospirillum multivorans TaxID=66821 RepID=A0AA86ALT3_SULMK|nr:bifunctional diguanylate cyclase/phosphodiesterase [Sulfurospirillum multivorans]AHJ11846.1 diguanylate cyclase/phosphodiesterase [Sulfurospirillum multivorans DSM 12446]QEH05352.1 diguanylate cyclase/phosphodiesterase [Sulfurospirillum multivorans]